MNTASGTADDDEGRKLRRADTGEDAPLRARRTAKLQRERAPFSPGTKRAPRMAPIGLKHKTAKS
jgi:hypothetical protein